METFGTIILILFCFALYFLPTIIGWEKNNVIAIFVLNLLLGWTLIGWLIALIWACCKDNEIPQININNQNQNKEDNIYKKLGELADLKDRGAITNAEYLRLKQKLIGLSDKELNQLRTEENNG